MVHRDLIHVWPFEIDREELTGKTEEENPGIESVGPILVDDATDLMRLAVRGNGLDEKAVIFDSFHGTVLHFETYQVFKVTPKVGERYLPGKQQGIVVGSRQEARNKVQALVENAATNIDTHKTTIKFLKLRNDLGFSAEGWAIRYDGMKRSYVVHERCQTCHGQGKNNCPDCKGRKVRACKTCQGTKLMICTLCKGKKRMPVPNRVKGKPPVLLKCKKCRGKGKIPCTICRNTGTQKCMTCQGSGKTGCKPCTNTGWRSHMTFLEVSAKCRFEYDKDALPPEVPPLIDFLKARMVTEQYAHIVINEDMQRKKELDNLHKPKEFLMRKPDEFAITYDVRLPWGDIAFIWDPRTEPVTGKLFGFHPSLVHMQPFLEEIALPGIRAIDEAATSARDVAGKIHEATRFRIIAETLLATARYNRARAVQSIMTLYPFGIRDEKLDDIVVKANTALKFVTQTPRTIGLVAGLAMTTVMDAAYYLGPVRDKLMEQMSDPQAVGLIDLSLVAIGGMVTAMLVKTLPKKAMMRALGPALEKKMTKGQKGKDEKLGARAGMTGFFGFAGSAVIYTVVLATAILQFGMGTPPWLELIKRALHIG